MIKTLALFAAPLLLAMPGMASAAVVTVDFDALGDQVDVGSSYAAQGVNFTGFTTAAFFGATSVPNIGYNGLSVAVADTDFGFTSLSFTVGFFSTGTISVYSGLGGTGTLLGSVTGLLGDPNAFAPGSVAFTGTARSFTLSGGVAQLGLDDVAFGVVPEPMTWTLMIGGFAMTGIGMRRRAALAA